MSYQSKIIGLELEHTVQTLPSVDHGKNVTWPLLMGVSNRGPILSIPGSRERERELLDYYHNDYNTLFPAATAVLAKQVQSTPWEITGDISQTEYYQEMFLNADFGRGMDSLLSKIVMDFLRFDFGAYIELIGPGDPMQPMTGSLVGVGLLDSLRCWPTGDPEFPVIYMDVIGQLHTMHYTRVVRFFDMPDTTDLPYSGYYHINTHGTHFGECALSRAISSVIREMLMNRYIEQKLDDNPPPGMMILKNISNQTLLAGIEQMEQDRMTDARGLWGRTVRLYGTQTEVMPEVEFVAFNSPPEAFDYETYKNICAREIAASVGVDVQDFWELTGGQNLGTATQSAILHEKAKGKALGRLLKGLERVFNLMLPEELQFEFKYRDPQEDQELANKAQTWVTIALALEPLLGKEQTARLLANQVEPIRDVITDEAGEVRLPDDDPKTPEQMRPLAPDVVVTDTAAGMPEDAVTVDDTEKQLVDTQRAFAVAFRSVISAANRQGISKALARQMLRGELQTAGENAYRDGLQDGGANEGLDDDAMQEVSTWRATQSPYIDKFLDEVYSAKDFNADEIGRRAQMWVNKALNPVYYMGIAKANEQQRYMWVVNPIKEHCADCLRMNGQIHRMKDYVKSGILPQSPKLECGGYQCGCSLVKTEQRAQGRIVGQPSGLRRITDFFRRIVSVFTKG